MSNDLKMQTVRSNNLTFNYHRLFQYKRETRSKGNYGFNLQKSKTSVVKIKSGKMTKNSNYVLRLEGKNPIRSVTFST